MMKRTTYEFTLPARDEMDHAEIAALYRLVSDLLGDQVGLEFAKRSDRVEISITTVDCP